MQENVLVENSTIGGTLKYLSTGALVDNFGVGNFVALKFNIPEDATSCLVGLQPSEGTGMQEIIDDPDKNGVWKITNKFTQKFKIVTSDGTSTKTKYYSLRDLELLSE